MPSTIKTRGSQKGFLRGLSTIALLKARFDEHADHLDMFQPLIVDTVNSMHPTRFTADEVGIALREKHCITIPTPTITTLLRRQVRRGTLTREHGTFVRVGKIQEGEIVSKSRDAILAGYRSLAGAFIDHAGKRGLDIKSTDVALSLILGFLEDNHVDLLLDGPVASSRQLSTKEARLVAEFCQEAIRDDPALASALHGIMQGLVLCNTAFLRDIEASRRQFRELVIYLDSHFVRQALGYEGPVQERVTRETLSLLTRAGARCRVFENTVGELRGILSLFERKLATPEGKRSLHEGPMTRHFLGLRPSDVAERNALLEVDIRRVGLQIDAVPTHVAAFTLDEKALHSWLADKKTGEEESPRIIHDVDCVAAILTLRRGRRRDRLDDANFVFAMVEGEVLQNVKKWFAEQGGSGVPPAVNLRALANLAWIRCPFLLGDIKLHELVALCSAALRPAPATWKRFREHLDALRKDGHLTSDEELAVVASKLTEQLLAEVDEGPGEPDATTLDEIVERVKSSYQEAARGEIDAYRAAAHGEREATEALARRELQLVSERARVAEQAAEDAQRRWLDVTT